MKLPVGYFAFHKDAFINYQLNRWHSLGYTRKEDIAEAAARIMRSLLLRDPGREQP